jgi:hypothetical protein
VWERVDDRHVHLEERREGSGPAAHPAVALTIDTEVRPPLILLIRGQAQL